MKTRSNYLSKILAVVLCWGLSITALAATFTVNSTEDPDATDVDSANCSVPNQTCSLREALAAADEFGDLDTIVFDVSGPVHLKRGLIAVEPVVIDGGGTTTVRVDQGYVITTLADRNDNPQTPGLCGELICPALPVLQPAYYSEGGANRQMLELHGSGSAVTGLILDGSITPQPADVGVQRIDFESNGSTDFFLFTIMSDGGGPGPRARWLVAGGVRLVLPLGTAEIIGNELRNFNSTAVLVEGAWPSETTPPEPVIAPVISGNIITGGAQGQPFASADGIVMYWVVGAEISNNVVSSFRSGLSAEYFAGLSATGNRFVENGTGIDLRSGDGSQAEILIDDNVISGNAAYGLSATAIGFGQISNNEVDGNGSHPELQGGILLVNASANSIAMNEVHGNSGFGIVIDGHFIDGLIDANGSPIDYAVSNHVARNDVRSNGGVGIVILNDSFFNTVESNDSVRNSTGIVAGYTAPFPYSNTFQRNTFKKNSENDVLDLDPICNDVWTDNEFKTVTSSTENCIQ
jgi:hypothetical protein